MSAPATAAAMKNRVTALDTLRGFFLAVILVNHIELYPSLFDLFTGRGRLLVSAAEGFFFMSGLLVGMVYRRRLALGMRFIFQKMWKRAFQLYLGSVVLTLLFTAAAVYLHHPTIKDGLFDVIDWRHIVSETLLMRYGFGWADFLDRFAILMFMAPFAFYLLVKGKWWLLMAASLAAWTVRGNNFTLSWQIVFLLGMMGGYYWNELNQKVAGLSKATRSKLQTSLYLITGITFAASYASVYALSLLNQKLLGLPHGLQTLTLNWNSVNEWVWLYAQKWTMGPIRIVLFLVWFTALFLLVSKHEATIKKYTWSVLELFGRNSLFVYIAHAFIVFIFKLFIPAGTVLWQNFLITALAFASLVGVTVFYSRLQIAKTKSAAGQKQRRQYLKAKLAES